ncbi:citramalate synthase [candidate division WOR-1 bacterium RIFOXYA2_FULL_36_21]|uniref:Citramalate synthase n=1 Tax=candidate division WOR-1 bacterium RIFOXYB2_FULL_36_35 TaxID=1802578 RepID=A0A1F4S8C8_UNCSA|nr:MAG: citramalate synthase [candidate division WOR-1 bacterium RIFOXYA2_FULL_36_21]OGC16705.1 MAG: citramalate synthase [candidate division WOR-1 bacterium RIFOXYB2_FULL_36_35]
MRKIFLYDTTLRDGAQTEGISFTVKDKLKIVSLLDDLGIDYIEGGWPGSNPKDIEFFKEAKKLKLKHAKIAAFSSTKRANIKIEEDKNIQTLLEADTPVFTIFGKTWDFHVTDALKTTLEENLNMISDTVSYLKSKGKEVVFDAEHFFDGFKNNPEYAFKCLKSAEDAGADILCLCDTNGGTLSFEIEKILAEVKKHIKIYFGIHAHNDSECAVSVSEMAVFCGATQVQGTINGYGERCGNANLCSILPILKIKMNLDCISDRAMKELTEVSRHIAEIANLPQSAHQPFVGRSAFAHKGGIHVSAILKNSKTYEHINPELVGNARRVTISDQSGISNLMYKAEKYGLKIDSKSKEVKGLVQKLKELEHEGYQFEEGEASFELLVKRILGVAKPLFELDHYEIKMSQKSEKDFVVEAYVKVKVSGTVYESKAKGDGPINALDGALRKVLEKKYPKIKNIKLTDYKVRVLDSKEGTAARVRVIIESCDCDKCWGTVGVSTNVIEASYLALVDSLEYGLLE